MAISIRSFVITAPNVSIDDEAGKVAAVVLGKSNNHLNLHLQQHKADKITQKLRNYNDAERSLSILSCM